MYFVTAGEVNLIDASGAPAGRAGPGALLGAADLFPPPTPAAAWAWAAGDAGDGCEPEELGPFRARTARVRYALGGCGRVGGCACVGWVGVHVLG